MKVSLLDKLACPFDLKELHLTTYKKGSENSILEGILTCTHCHRYYPIVYGIPIMSPDEYRVPALEQPLLQKWGIQIQRHEETNDFRLLPDFSDQKKQ